MAKKVYKADALSVSDMRKLADDLHRYANSLEHKARLLAERLSERGVEVARVRIADLDAIFTGELLSSIHSEYKGSFKGGGIFMVVADSSHALFVEYGTLGSMGGKKEYPYPFPEGVSWEYGSGKTIHLRNGEYGWWYPKNGKWYWSSGMDARPFMMETAVTIHSIVAKTAKEIFSK